MNRQLLLITGVSSGVGRSLAKHFAKCYHAIGIARKLAVAQEALAGVPDVTLHSADLPRPEEVSRVLDEVIGQYGAPANVINNAGVNIRGRLDALPIGRICICLEVKCLAAVIITIMAAREFADRGVHINLLNTGPFTVMWRPLHQWILWFVTPLTSTYRTLPPTGRFFCLGHEIPLFPNLEGLQWLEGRASDRAWRIQ